MVADDFLVETSVDAAVLTNGQQVGRLRVGPRGYDMLVERGSRWRAAIIEYDLRGHAQIFRAAGVEDDGALLVRERRMGAKPHSRSGRVEPTGKWSTDTVRRVRGKIVRTSARGELGRSDQAVVLQRQCTASDGAPIWVADAVMTREPDTNHPGRAVFTTVGGFSFPNGRGGSFQTVASVDGTSSDWRLPGGVGRSAGVSKSTLPDGTKVTERSEMSPSGVFHRSKETEKVVKDSDGVTHTDRTFTEEAIGSGSSVRVSSETHEVSKFFDKDTGTVHEHGDTFQVETTTRHVDAAGNVTTEHEVDTFDQNSGVRTDATRVEHSDGSVELKTFTHDGTDDTLRVQTFGPQGDPRSDTTTPMRMTQDGDWVPDTSTPADSGQSSEQGGPDSGETTGNGGSDSGGANSSGGKDDESEHQGSDSDPDLGGGDEAASDDSGDGGYGEDTGHPGLSWDGQSDGPLSFLRGHGGSFGDGELDGDLDALGSDEMVALFAQALRAAVTAPPPTDDGGLGADTPDSTAPVTLTLGDSAHSVVDPWGDWGTSATQKPTASSWAFSNPKRCSAVPALSSRRSRSSLRSPMPAEDSTSTSSDSSTGRVNRSPQRTATPGLRSKRPSPLAH